MRPCAARPAVIALALATLTVTSLMPLACDKLPMEPARARDGSQRGITFADWTHDGYGRPEARRQIQALALTGATEMWILVTGYQTRASDRVIHDGGGRTPTFEAVRRAADEAQRLGLGVVLKPHVDVEDGTWRGAIDPGGALGRVDAWFASYAEFILRWAALAADIGATQLVVGTELASMIAHESKWREVISHVRQSFPGSLTYAASWDEAQRVGFWDALDVVGVNAYFPVAQRRNPGRSEILAGWQPWLDRLERLRRRTGRDIVLTEIGYRSVDGAGLHPYRFDNAAAVDLEEQADLYWAALQATGDQAWIRGVVWWNWLARETGEAAAQDYTPAGKPACNELRAAWLLE